MSGPQVALAVVGVLAAVALLGVVVLLMQLRSLRRQLTAAQAGAATTAEPQQPPAPQMPALLEPDPLPSREIARRGDISWLDIGGTALVRVAAVTHGVRQALAPANRDRIAALVRRDLRRRERLRRKAARRAARVLPIEAAHVVDTALPPAAGPERRDIAS